MRALLLYKNACARFLEIEAKETFDRKDKNIKAVREELIATIHVYEKLIQFTVCLKVTQLSNAQILQNELLKL